MPHLVNFCVWKIDQIVLVVLDKFPQKYFVLNMFESGRASLILFCELVSGWKHTEKSFLADLWAALEHLTHLQSADQSKTVPVSNFGSSVYICTLSTPWIWSQKSVAKNVYGNQWKPTDFTTSSKTKNSVSV